MPEKHQIFPVADQKASFPGGSNVELSADGRVGIAFDHAELTSSGDKLHYFSSQFIETIDADGNPIAFAAANKTVWMIQNGSITADEVFSTDVIQDLQMITIPASTSPNVTTVPKKYLMAVFGSGSTINGNAVRDMGTGTWTTNTGATFFTAFFLRRVGDHLYAATGAAATGRTVLGEWNVAVCPPSSDPQLAASWSAGSPVGGPEWPISGMAGFEDRICVAKGDGFYIRDQQEKKFKNMAHHLAVGVANGATGKVCVAGEGCVWFGTNDGGLFRFDGRQLNDETPFRGMEKPRDMPQGRVSMLADRGDVVYAVLECWSDVLEGKHARDAGLRVFKDDGGVITELTNTTDGDMSTGGDMAAWGNATIGTDKLVFAFPRPLEALGVRVLSTSTDNSAVQSFTAPEALNGAGSWTTLGSIVDGSILSVTGVSLAVTGFPASSGQSIIGWTGIDGFKVAGLEAAAPTGFSGTNLYWYRVSNAAATTGMTAGTVINEAFVVVARPGLPDSGLLSQSTNFTNRMRAGGITRVLEGKRRGGRIIWSDKYSLHTLGGVYCGGWTQSPSVGGGNSGQQFVLLGRFRQMAVWENSNRDSTQAKYARLVQVTSTEPAPVLAVYNVRMGKPNQLTYLHKVWAAGIFVQPTDKIQLVIQLDENVVYDAGVRSGTYATWDMQGENVGPFYRASFFFIFSDATQFDPAAPYWVSFLAEYSDSGVEWDIAQHGGFPSSAERV